MNEQSRTRNVEFDQNSEYLVFHNLEQVRHRRSLARWPLHITVVPSFQLPVHRENDLKDLVREIAGDYQPIVLAPGGDEKFGPNFDRPVTTVIDTSGELKGLHERFMWDLGSLGCNEIDATYANDKYVPHMTWVRGVFPPTASFSLNTLSIARKTGKMKTMVETTRIEY